MFSTPFKRWPLGHHIIAATAVILVLAALGIALLKITGTALQQKASLLRELQKELTQMRAATGTTTIATMDFRASLPPASRLEGVSRDILQYADQRGVRLTSVAQQPGPISGQGIKTLEYTISAVTAYPAFKVWLADLLGRYPTLAVQQLSIRANGTDGLRQDVSLSLLFAYKE